MKQHGFLAGLCMSVYALSATSCAGPATEASNKGLPVAAADSETTRPTTELREQPAPVMTSANFPPPLPAHVRGEAIRREDLLSLLEAGVPRFLAQLEVRAEKHQGRFQGWRLLAIKPAPWSNSVLRPGDLVLRVNNHGLERPEQFMQVWESLQGATEIVFEIVRGDQPSEVRFAITDEPLPVTQDAPQPPG